MINVIKKNIMLILSIILIIYFSLNFLGGNRGLFAYLDKKNQFENLLEKKLFLTNEITKVKKITKTPVVAIGGVNSDNYKKLLLNKANFLAISGYIWKNKKMKPIEAINKII